MTTTTGIERGLIDRIKKLSLIDELVNTTFVNDENHSINIKQTKKIFGIHTTKAIELSPKLNHTQIIYKDNKKYSLIITDETCVDTILLDKKICEYVSERLNRQFLEHLLVSNTEQIKWSYLKKNWIGRIISGKRKHNLIKKIIETGANWGWMILHENIYRIIKDSTFFFEEPGKDCCGIIHRGFIRMDGFSIRVYSSSEIKLSKIYFGNQNSVHLLLKKKFDIKKIKGDTDSFSIGVDYSFVSTGETLLLEL